MTGKNRLLALAFRAAALVRLPKGRAERNFAFNQACEARLCGAAAPGCINGQRTAPTAELRYGLRRYAQVGCEVIAVYNALCLLGLRVPLSEIGRRFEVCGGQMLFGLWGTDPFSVERALAGCGVRLHRAETAAALSAEAEKAGRAVLIVSFWNQKGNVFRGIHTVAAEYAHGEYFAFNRFDASPRAAVCGSLEALLGRGGLIVGYLAEREPQEP